MGDNIWLDDRNGVRTPMQWTPGANAGFSEASPDKLYSPVISTPPYSPAEVNVAGEVDDPGSLCNFIRSLIDKVSDRRRLERAFHLGGV